MEHVQPRHKILLVYGSELIGTNPSRRTISKKLCEAWERRQPNGALRDIVCRGMLLMLDRAGKIALPPVSYVRHNPLAKRARPAPMLVDTTPITRDDRAGWSMIIPARPKGIVFSQSALDLCHGRQTEAFPA